MATLKGQTIAASYQDLVKRADTYSQTGTNVEIMDDNAVVKPTGLYLESGATTDNVGIGVSDPDELLELYKVGTQLKLSGGAADYATFAVAADGALTITTVDVDAAEADIILAPDGNIGIGDTTPESLLHMKGANPVLTIQDTETAAGSADARIRLAESDGSGNVENYWDIHNSGANLLLTRSDGSGNVGIGGGTSPAVDLDIEDTTTSSASQGGNLRLGSNDGAVMASGHRLGVLEFAGAEDASNTMTVGARIEALADATWSTSENGADLLFYTTDGNASQSEQMRITADGTQNQQANYIVNEQGRQDHVANTMPAPYYRFDGSNDTIDVADSAHLSFGDGTSDSPFSISAWINVEDATAFPIANKGTYNSDGEWRFRCSSDVLQLIIYDESVASTYEQAYTTATVPENKWIHVCGTYNGVGGTSACDGIKLYINGISEALTASGDGTYVAMENLADEVRIGNYNDTTYAQGSIAGLKIHNHELSAAEVKELYSGASVPFKYKRGYVAYEGDFSSDTDSWGSNNLTLAGNIDSIEDGASTTKNNTLRGTLSGGSIHHTFNRAQSQVAGKTYRLQASILIPSGNTKVDGFIITGSSSWNLDQILTNASAGANWVTVDETYTATKTDSIYVWTTDGGAITQDQDGDLVYIAEWKLTQLGAVAEYDGSTAGAHQWGDKSGNELHGTVGDGAGGATAPTLENTPYDAGTEYEEGTWDGVISDGSTDMTMHATYDTGYYTKVGNLVTVSGYFVTSSLNGLTSESIKITGLPFTVANDGAAYSGGTAGYGGSLAITAGESVCYYGVPNQSYITLMVWDATTGSTAMLASEWDDGGEIIIGFSYRAA